VVDTPDKPLKEKLDSFEKQLLVDALEQNNWDNRAATRMLEVEFDRMLEVEFDEFQKLYQKHNLKEYLQWQNKNSSYSYEILFHRFVFKACLPRGGAGRENP
jgi:hypothetical protein